MKTFKLFFTFCLLMTIHGNILAQTQKTILRAEHIRSSQLPPEVLDAYKKKFPQANLKDILKLPTQVYKKDWEIDELNRPDGNQEYYSLSMTGKDVDLEALYDKYGNLIRANEVARNVKLPRKISTYVVTNYKGYVISADRVKRLIEPNQVQAEWEVQIKKGNELRRLLFGKDGTFIKEKI